VKDDTFLKPALLFGRIGEALISDSTVAFSLRRRQAHVELESAGGREEANLDGERKKNMDWINIIRRYPRNNRSMVSWVSEKLLFKV